MYWGKEIPFYLQVAETLRGRIKDGEYQLGEIFPSHRELEEEFHVSNITIRKALNLLTQEGYLTAKKGVRAEVAKQAEDFIEIEITSDFKGLEDSIAGRKHQIEAEVLKISMVSGQKRIREILSLKPEDKVWCMTRVRKMKGQPISSFINYGPPDLIGKIRKKDVEKKNFIDVFQYVCGVKISRMEQRIHAIVADVDLSRLLGVNYADPLFFVENIHFSKKNKAVAVTHAYFRGDRYLYFAVTETV
jgi:DNA-binding GntR family transcriptional regulator